MKSNSKNTATMAWIALGGLLAVGFTVLIAMELPSMRRELRLMRM
ncbi:MAG TPA: hypothetical protein VL361_08780 [Candidatus Limnocylindrales bacterium]|jgi:hypothetical protein|nr:hypothetical protein [Candidatus Limnocylindrales bacterium]